MKNLTLLFALIISGLSFGQLTVADDLSWLLNGAVTSADSDDFPFCNGTDVFYNVSVNASSSGFQNAQGGLAGMIIPADPTNDPDQTMDFVFTFSQQVNNLRIHVVDLDENASGVANYTTAEEYLTNISPACNGVTVTAGSLFPLTFPSTTVTPYDGDASTTNDNSSGWVEWTSPVTTVSFTLNRPSSGWGVIIDGVEFECCEPVVNCVCSAEFELTNLGQPSPAGVQNSTLEVNSQGELITSLEITLPYFVSLVDEECLRCGTDVESYGTFTTASPIGNVGSTLVDPFGLGYSRKIRYEFPVPTAINDVIDLTMLFPPILDLSCCKNQVDYCLDVSLRKDDCSSCDYTVCTNSDFNNGDSNGDLIDPVKKSAQSSIVYNDFVTNEVLKISPNPATSEVTIELTGMHVTNGELILNDTMGNTLVRKTITENILSLDVSGLAKGSYVISVLEGDVKISKLLIVQ